MSLSENSYKLGIDIGSTTAKIVIFNAEGKIVFNRYGKHNTYVYQALIAALKDALDKLGDIRLSAAITGTAGMGVSERNGIKFSQEVIAATNVVNKKYPEVSTLIDIGGEDTKMIFFQKGKSPDIRMNGNCAGGTGAFIEQMATLLNVKIEDINDLAAKSQNHYPIASRCGVFAKTDIQNLLARKVEKADIASSIFHAVGIQTLNTLSRGYEVRPKVMFIGGPLTFMPELRKKMLNAMNLTENDMILPEFSEYFPAQGAALEAEGDFLLSDLIKNFEKSQDVKAERKDRLPQLFSGKDDFENWLRNRHIVNPQKVSLNNYQGKNLFLGIDSGSTTSKVVIIGDNNELLYSLYTNNDGNTLGKIHSALKAFYTDNKDILLKKNFNITASAVTGYGEDLVKAALGIDYGIVETLAHFSAAKFLNPEVDFIMDIGGQDMKAIFIQGGVINRIELNESCSAGCGSFIETFAKTLGMKTPEFAITACESPAPCDLGTRCTVFMNSKVKQSLRENATVSDISAGLAYSVIKNALFKVLKLKNFDELGQTIVVQGGTFKNPAVYRAFELLTGKKLTSTEIPEMMGAFGAAIYAKDRFLSEGKSTGTFLGLENIDKALEYSNRQIICKGCENNCLVTAFKFSNKQTYYSGNKCQKVFNSKGEKTEKGENLFAYRYNLLFDRKKELEKPVMTVIIPRVLNQYSNYPFWHTLLTECNINVIITPPTTVKMYESGSGTIMSDNICYPAKLVHGHIIWAVSQKPDRIFYPIVTYEKNDFKGTENSFNCPIVSGYADVIKSSIDPYGKYGIPFDSPTVNFNDEALLYKTCRKYLKSIGISAGVIKKAFKAAVTAQKEYRSKIAVKAMEIIEKSKHENKLLVVLAGRPYHADPLINQKTPDIIADLGANVISEDSLSAYLDVMDLQIIPQWAYPNRILNAAQWVAEQDQNITFVQLNSFGCGPDAVLVDEVTDILRAAGKSNTVIRIDEINSTGSILLRIRSLMESFKVMDLKNRPMRHERETVKPFGREDKGRMILAPYFAEGYSDILPVFFQMSGYNLVNLPKPDKRSVEWGLRYANNEICYPATIVVGDMIKAIKEGQYDRDKIAFAITQTGGQCRASSYLALMKKALISAGYSDIPIITVGTAGKTINQQPGFYMNWLKFLPVLVPVTIYTDTLLRFYYILVVREKHKGETLRFKDKYMRLLQEEVPYRQPKKLYELMAQMVEEANSIEIFKDKKIPKIGIVGEIYVKYNKFGHRFISDKLVEEGVEVVFPPILEFFTQEIVNVKKNWEMNLTHHKFSSWVLVEFFNMYINNAIAKSEKILKKSKFPFVFESIKQIAKDAEETLSLSNQFGEGWLISAEISSFAKQGINNIISVQPFGCIANQIISKGIEKNLKKKYPNLNLLFLDYDDGASDVNITNRLYFMLKNLE
jgi:predicted CoA-substrate-specific enzyme activase